MFFRVYCAGGECSGALCFWLWIRILSAHLSSSGWIVVVLSSCYIDVLFIPSVISGCQFLCTFLLCAVFNLEAVAQAFIKTRVWVGRYPGMFCLECPC